MKLNMNLFVSDDETGIIFLLAERKYSTLSPSKPKDRSFSNVHRIYSNM